MNTQKEYKALHQAIFNCVLCKEIGKEIHRVQPEWDENKKPSHIKKWAIIVGQAPGITEKKHGESIQKNDGTKVKIPFSGRAGKQFKQWFTDANIDYIPILKNSLITSLTKCYPGRYRGNDRKPGAKEIKLCEPFLKKQIELVAPEIIIPIGKQSIDWFFPEHKNSPLEHKIGHFLKWNNYTVLCFPHPSPASAVIKRPEIIHKIAETILLLNQQWKQWEQQSI